MVLESLSVWNRHLKKGREENITVRRLASKAGGDSQLWAAESSKHDGSVYIVTYHASAHASGNSEAVTCTCMAGQHGKACKHVALVIATLYQMKPWEYFPEDAQRTA